LPISPASLKRRASWRLAPSTVSGAAPMCKPLAFAAEMIFAPSATVVASGFSV